MKHLFYTFLLTLFIVCTFSLTRIDAAGKKDKSCYLFSYFKGNGEDGLHLAYSRDGFKWTALKRGKSFLKPGVGKDKLMRDPSIAPGPDGRFHMVWTSSWRDRIIGYADSKDLVHWSKQKAIPVMMHEPKARNCWAPELFYDRVSEKFYIIWSTTIPGRFPKSSGSSESSYNHRIYYTSTQDFKDFAPTKLFFDPGYSVIDGFLAKEGKKYLLFFKDETRFPRPKKIILLAESKNIEGPYTHPKIPVSKQTWIEGPSAIKIGNKWFVYFDCYRKHCYGCCTSTDLKNWVDINDRISFPPGTRHGTAFKVQPEILNKLLKQK